jgi:hypothetical protein
VLFEDRGSAVCGLRRKKSGMKIHCAAMKTKPSSSPPIPMTIGTWMPRIGAE